MPAHSSDPPASAFVDENVSKKKRKPRQLYSCAECRRLKLKCDRQVPCANCVRRNCLALCPDDIQRSGKSEETAELRQRLDALESLLGKNDISLLPTHEQTKSTTTGRHHKRLDASKPAVNTFPELRDKILEEVSPHPSMGRVVDSNRDRSASPRHRTNALDKGEQSSRTTDSLITTPTHHTGTNFSPSRELSRFHYDFTLPGDGVDQPLIPSLPLAQVPPIEEVTGQERSAFHEEPSFGTLLLSHGGRSKYLGPTAAIEWLRDQEVQDPSDTPAISRPPSPHHRVGAHPHNDPSTFPFELRNRDIIPESLKYYLPDVEEATLLVDSYYRYFAWNYDIAPRNSVRQLLEKAYANDDRVSKDISAQELGLLYSILAMGALHNLEVPPNDSSVDDYISAAKICLTRGAFLSKNTVAGVQTLHVMAHCHLEMDRGHSSDSAWPLWGLAMRLIQAMGLHRDGERWSLPPEIVAERRRVFWESMAADVLQANCFSRPNAIPFSYIDTKLPDEPTVVKGFFTLKFELCRLSGSILDLTMRLDNSPYSAVQDLHRRACEFEQNVPYIWRCRTALIWLPSAYPDSNLAVSSSPEITKRDLPQTFQQFTLAILISETILFLHRPYFARALHECIPDPTRSVYGQSYLVVVERCNCIIQVVSALYALHPAVCARQWFLWYHAFNSAVCMGTLILQNPQNALTSFALAQIDSTITIHTSVVQLVSSSRMMKNLQWLIRLRTRALTRIQLTSQGDVPIETSLDDDREDHIELLGLRTRLIQRASRGMQTATTISSTTPNQTTTTPSPSTAMTQTITDALRQYFGDEESNVPQVNLNPMLGQTTAPLLSPLTTSTDDLLHQFWDPRVLPGGNLTADNTIDFSSTHWWDGDANPP